MPKQEYKILEFHGGTNNKFDARDIGDNQNAFSQISIRYPGRLTKEGDCKNLYSKTDLNGHPITNITASSGGFERGYGLFSFSHDYDMEGDEIDTDFICINDANGIDIYDPNQSTEWQDNKLYVGSRTSTVKPEYYNVDGALRVCDSNFSVTDVAIDTDAVISKNDVVLTTESGTIATGSIIQIEQEIMYVTSGSSGGTSITVIRGFANTKITSHLTNQSIFYVNIPKYFGHIKQDRLFECDSSDSINAWVEDVQTPQPPNNTRKSDGTSGTLASSLGVQSLRIYDIIEASTSNYPAESEKVILEFGESPAGTGIKNVQVSGDTVTFTTSGYGSDASGTHRLSVNDEIILSNMHDNLSVYNGNHIVTGVTSTTFSISFSEAVETLDGSGALYYANASAWVDDTGDFPNNVEVTVADSLIPFLDSSEAIYTAYNQTAYIHITGQTGVNAYNGVFLATRVADNKLRFETSAHGSVGSIAGTTQIQQLIGRVAPVDSGDIINEDLKRKWNFAMSFTYDGPAQEVQESLLTNGHSVVLSTQANGIASNLMDDSGGINDSVTEIGVDDASVFTINESVIMIGAEQMLVTGVDTGATPQHIDVTRAYNGSTAGSHSDDAPIYLISELTPTSTIDWTNFIGAPQCVIKTVYNHGVDEKTWNARINGFKIYMKDVTEQDASKEWRLFSHVNFNKGTYTLFAAGDSELILEQPGTWATGGEICTISTGTELTIKPVDTYLSENLFTEDTIIDAQYKCSETVGRRTYIGNIRQGGRTYPDRMLRSPVNKFDTFPETNFIDVAVGDGDRITALKSFGDRLLQFKKDTVYIINISGESEVLEAEYPNAGIVMPSQVTKTNIGIAWVNPSGLWFFDGKQVQNLTRHVEKDNYLTSMHTGDIPLIGFDKYTNRLIYTPKINTGLITIWYMYDLELQAYQAYFYGDLFPHSNSGTNYYTNFINDADGNMIIGYVDSGVNTELNFYQWSNDAGEGQSYFATALWKSKDIDLASPAVNKKIYKVYVTYKCTGHSGVKMKYATDGGTSFSDFSSSSSTNYNVESFSTNGTATGFKDTDGAWAVAELKPASSINNVKSIQLSLDQNYIDVGTAQGGSSTTIQVDTGNSTDADAYNDYNISIHDGPARYNAEKITDYAVNRTATVSTMTDKGYGNAATSASIYILGAMATDFEINDITIIYRPKRIK